MDKKKTIFITVFAILLTAVAIWCGINVILGLIFSVSKDADGFALFYNGLATLTVSAVCALNALCSCLLSVALLYRKINKVIPITLLVLDGLALIVVVASMLV